jgi:hypothetical protein
MNRISIKIFHIRKRVAQVPQLMALEPGLLIILMTSSIIVSAVLFVPIQSLVVISPLSMSFQIMICIHYD